jgi:hypothetical protein
MEEMIDETLEGLDDVDEDEAEEEVEKILFEVTDGKDKADYFSCLG